jgi:hypothetical protein
MKNAVIIAILSGHLLITGLRLPEWKDNISIWVAAAQVEPLDPWCLANAAHFTHDKRAGVWLFKFFSLYIPNWLPVKDREPYVIGIKSLCDSLRASGFPRDSDICVNRMNEIVSGHKMIVTYVAQ